MTYKMYLLRHAQSADKQTGQSDKQRILSPSGKKDAMLLGNFLKTRNQIPDFILTSSATRALSMSAIVAHEISFSPDLIKVEEELYEATPGIYWDITRGLDLHHQRVLITGHNPAISAFAGELTGTSIDMKPCELACIQIRKKWDHVAPRSGTLDYIFNPASFGNL